MPANPNQMAMAHAVPGAFSPGEKYHSAGRHVRRQLGRMAMFGGAASTLAISTFLGSLGGARRARQYQVFFSSTLWADQCKTVASNRRSKLLLVLQGGAPQLAKMVYNTDYQLW